MSLSIVIVPFAADPNTAAYRALLAQSLQHLLYPLFRMAVQHPVQLAGREPRLGCGAQCSEHVTVERGPHCFRYSPPPRLSLSRNRWIL